MNSLGWSLWSRQSSRPPFGKHFRMLRAGGFPETSLRRRCVESSRLACEPPANSGRTIRQWIREELRNEVIKRGLVENNSSCQISRYLRDAHLQPRRRKMWIITKKKEPVEFQRKVEEVWELQTQNRCSSTPKTFISDSHVPTQTRVPNDNS